jgi:hypothetical protein
MSTSEHYRAKASEYAKLSGIANDANEAREFAGLERSFTELADNAQWVTENHDQTVHAAEHAPAPLTPEPPAQGSSQQ